MAKFDMHCHTKEGSLDGKIHLEEYVSILKSKGYSGMLVTDHNSYEAYRHYTRHQSDEIFKDFVLLKGIEYDTIDAGHILVIMPEHTKLPLLELRGLPVSILIDLVHRFGGILGPAHPCGEKYLSLLNTRRYRKNPAILGEFDFMETFNACEAEHSNRQAAALAAKYNLPGFGGSDAHKTDCAGFGFTEFETPITCESELIAAVRAKACIRSGGTLYHGTTKEKIGRANDLLVYSFWLYNKTAGLMRCHQRHLAMASCGFSVRNT
ncbi:MAG: PHP domain-containing protein [Lachnospiraceae bacterium]|nr:PHP domain-containing protein [Lachnospiraceae bacterium]